MRCCLGFRALVLLLVLLIQGGGACPISRAQQFSAADFDFFESKIRPLLTKRCFACHRANTDLQSELDLGSRESILRGGSRGPAAIPGKKDESLMLQAIRGQHELQMPPDGRLSASETALLEGWVIRGLPWPEEVLSLEDRSKSDHWAFQPLQVEAVPDVRQASWPRTSIDYFILAEMEQAGLSPNPPATRRELIRRVTYDLTGLPPTPAEISAFLTDPDPNAYEKLIDRLLASPHYGERWARHWLDVVRYADSKDLRDVGGRQDITETYKYRDWVVRALNFDLPYDQFMVNQIAGDLLATSTDGKVDPDRIIATGMLAFGVWGPGDSDVEKMHTDMVDDMINVTTRSFLSLTVACARCHDHKFDPITQEDYYALAGVFFSSEIAPPGTSAAWVRIPLVPEREIEEFNLKETVRKKRVSEIAKKAEDLRNLSYRSLVARNASATERYIRAVVPALVEGGTPQPEGTFAGETKSEPTLRADALEQWRLFLELRPRRFAALNQIEENAWKRDSVFRWHVGRDVPFAVLNSSDQTFDVPSSITNTYFGRIFHAEGPGPDELKHLETGKVYLSTDDGAPTNGIASLLFRAPCAGKYDVAIRLENCLDAGEKRDPFFHVVVNGKLMDQGRLRGHQAKKSLSYQLTLETGDTVELCASGGGVSFPSAIMEADVIVRNGSNVWDAAKEFHSPSPGSPVVSELNPLAGNVWEYGYRVMLGEVTDRWAFMNPSEFRHMTLAAEDGPNSAGDATTGPDLNVWATPTAGRMLPQSMAVHPGPRAGVGIEWISPIDGKVELAVRIDELQSTGDKVCWHLDYRPLAGDLTIASGEANRCPTGNPHASQIPQAAATISVRQGDALRICIDANKANVVAPTGIDWTVQEIGGNQRTWSIVDDLVQTAPKQPAAWRLVDLNPETISREGHSIKADFSVSSPVARQMQQASSEAGLQAVADWLRFYTDGEVPKVVNVESINATIDDLQSELDQLVRQLGQNPEKSQAVILASPVGRLYVDLISEEGPFRYDKRDDRALLPPESCAAIEQLDTARKQLEANPTPMYGVAMGVREGGVKGTKYEGFHDAQVHEQGHYAKLGKSVPRGFPKVIVGKHTASIPDGASGRLQLASWLSDPKNPLPARVMVNRIWLQHFGQGLVRTPGNFGILGEEPTNQKVLDHLARSFIDANWSIKAIHREILLSSTYCQSTETTKQQLMVDPDNRYWSRMLVRRLDAEEIRDTLLAVSGQLDETLGGPVTRERTADADAMSKRRAVYLMTNRSDKSGFRFLFDAADPENVVDQRNVSTVAPQALFLLNHPFVLELLPSLADKSRSRLTPDSPDAQFAVNVGFLYNLLYGREATSDEIKIGTKFIRDALRDVVAENRVREFKSAWQRYCQALLCTNELIYLN